MSAAGEIGEVVDSGASACYLVKMLTSHFTAAERVADQAVLFSGLDHDDDLVAECAASGVILAEGEHWIDYVEAARSRLDGVAEHASLTPRGL